jgi:hypothetical protein
MVSPLDQLSEECNRLLFEAVNEKSLSKLQLVNRTYSPNQLLTSLAQRNEEGETPLTVAMKRKNVPVIKEMVTWILDYSFPKKECKTMPIFIIDEIFHHIPVLESDELYECDTHFHRFDRESWLELIGLVFLQSTSLSRQDKIIALELIGALAIIHCHERHESMSRLALKCWREAMTLRYFPQDGEPLLPKVPAICVPTRASSNIFGSADEIMTMEELKLLEQDFERNSSSNSDLTLLFEERLLIQALLVMRRIFTQANLGHPHWLYLESLLGYVPCMTDHKFVINIYLFIFEQLNGFDPKLISRRSFNVFINTIHFFSSLFFFVWSDNPALEELTFDNLLALTKFIVTISEFFPNPAMISSVQFRDYHFAEIVYRFLSELTDIPSRITDQEKPKLEEYLSYFIRNFFPERTTTVLHWAANEAHLSVDDRWVYYMVHDDLEKTLKLKEIHTRIKLILHLGADVNAIDEKGRTPLHILAGIKEHHLNAEFVDIFQTLVDAGSHLYLADDDGKTVISILRGNVKRNQNNEELPSQHYFESLINDVFPLTCLCARVIRRHRIPFLKDQLPLTLHKLVSP